MRNTATTTKTLNVAEMVAIAAKFRAEEEAAVEKFRAKSKPCKLCGHVAEMSDDGRVMTVCFCVYSMLRMSLPKANSPESSPSGLRPMDGIEIRVKSPSDYGQAANLGTAKMDDPGTPDLNLSRRRVTNC